MILEMMNMEKKLTASELPIVRKRLKNTNKYDYGSILIIGGSIGYFGAPALSAFSAYRTGSGLVTVLLQKGDYPLYTNFNPEVMVKPYYNLTELNEVTQKKRAVLFGPGLKINDQTNEDVLRFLLQSKVPLVVDASGLAILHCLLEGDYDFHNVIVTPHTGEAQKLLDCEHPEEELSKLTNLGITVVLKDAYTVIASRKEKYLADLGNPGMATAGSGDVLSGMIVSLLGQGYTPLEAAKLGVYLHQSAGNLARDEVGEDSMMASDIIKKLPEAIRLLK